MLDIKITRTTCPKEKPQDESKLGFGKKFTDHMFVMDYTEGEGWHDARIVPYAPFQLDPATVVFHYAQEIFEGMKAYRTADDTIQLFRPECNAKRMQDSADRLCIPKIPVEDMKKAYELGVFDATQSVVNQSSGVIIGETSIHFDRLIPGLEFQLESMTIGSLLSLWFQTLVVGLTMNILSICIFLVTYGRMIEIYVVTALGPIPLATMGSSEWRSTGQNYLKSLLALGFQAFLIMIVVGIYAVLIRNISGAADIAGAIWGCMGYTVLLCFCLFKTGSISKSVFGAH